MEYVIVLLATGALAGTMAGLLGIGGGVVIVPALALVLLHRGEDPAVLMHVAIGTSLATIVPTALSSIRAHHRRGAVRWDVFLRLTPGVLVGALAGAALADALPGGALRLIFALFLLAVAAQLAFGKTPRPQRRLPGPAGLAAAGGVIGAVSSLVGIGGGSMTVPFLAWCNVAVRNAVATSAAVGLPIAVAGAAGFVATGWAVPGRPEMSLGYVNLPALVAIASASVLTAPLGARLAHRIPELALRRVFAAFLVVVALRLLLG